MYLFDRQTDERFQFESIRIEYHGSNLGVWFRLIGLNIKRPNDLWYDCHFIGNRKTQFNFVAIHSGF